MAVVSPGGLAGPGCRLVNMPCRVAMPCPVERTSSTICPPKPGREMLGWPDEEALELRSYRLLDQYRVWRPGS